MNDKNVWHSVDEIQEALLGGEVVTNATIEGSHFSDVIEMSLDSDYENITELMLDVIRFGKNSQKIEEFSDYMIEECRVFAESIKEEV